MAFTFRLDKRFQEVAKLQITHQDYSEETKRQFDLIWPVIKDRPIRRVLDLGCGLGRAAIYLNHLLSDKKVKWILADYNEIVTPQYGWMRDSRGYNSLELTKEFCLINRLRNFKTINLATRRLWRLRNIDLVISLYAVGYHWPIEPYLPVLRRITSDNAMLIFQVGMKASTPAQRKQRKQDLKIGGIILEGEYLLMNHEGL
jgi:SAM-dependent methyltransferase